MGDRLAALTPSWASELCVTLIPVFSSWYLFLAKQGEHSNMIFWEGTDGLEYDDTRPIQNWSKSSLTGLSLKSRFWKSKKAFPATAPFSRLRDRQNDIRVFFLINYVDKYFVFAFRGEAKNETFLVKAIQISIIPSCLLFPLQLIGLGNFQVTRLISVLQWSLWAWPVRTLLCKNTYLVYFSNTEVQSVLKDLGAVVVAPAI